MAIYQNPDGTFTELSGLTASELIESMGKLDHFLIHPDPLGLCRDDGPQSDLTEADHQAELQRLRAELVLAKEGEIHRLVDKIPNDKLAGVLAKLREILGPNPGGS